MTGSEPVMICNVWHVIARLSPAEEEESSEVRLWRKLCFGTTTCLFSDWVSRSLFYLQHLIRVCSSVRAYLIISTGLSTNNFLLRLSQNNISDWSRLYFQLGEIIISSVSVMLMICLIFVLSKVREWRLGGPHWICHSTPPHRYSPVSADYPTFQSVPPPLLSPHSSPRTSSHLTNCLAHSLLFALHHFLNSITPRRSSFTCLLLALTVSPDKQSPAEQMTSLMTISRLRRSLFSISAIWLTEWESVNLSSTTSYQARLHWAEESGSCINIFSSKSN